MNLINRIKTEWPLRIGLGLMYLYSSQSLFREPEFWYGYVPEWFESLISPLFSVDIYLRLQGGLEFLFGLIFIAWFAPKKIVKFAAGFGSIMMLGILIFSGIDQVTFRDFGILGGLIGLFVLKTKEEN